MTERRAFDWLAYAGAVWLILSALAALGFLVWLGAFG